MIKALILSICLCFSGLALAAEPPPQTTAAQDTLKEESTKALVTIIHKVTEAGQFLVDQIPLIIKELITYHILADALWLAFIATLFGFSTWGLLTCCKLHKREPHEEWEIGIGILFACDCALALLFAPPLFDLLKLLVAPRIWLIEYAAHLVK